MPMEMDYFKVAYTQHRQGSQSMRQFIITDDRAFRAYTLAGGQVSDQTRIEWMQDELSVAAVVAMEQHKALLRSLGKSEQALKTEWLAFSNALITVCSDILAVPAATLTEVPATVQNAGKDEQVPRKKATDRTLEKAQVTAIHRYATSEGLDFSDVSLEEVWRRTRR